MSVDLEIKKELDKIHSASMKILATSGIKLHSPEAMALFAERGVKVNGLTVYPSEEFIMETIASAPKSFTVYSRKERPPVVKKVESAGSDEAKKPEDGEKPAQDQKDPAQSLEAENQAQLLEPCPEMDMIFDGQRSYYAPAYGCPAITEKNGLVRPSTLDDYIKIAQLIHVCPHFMVNGGILVQPTDIDPDNSAIIMLYTSLLASDKCLMLIPTKGETFIELLYLVGITCGGEKEFAKYPRSLTLISTLSPLGLSEEAFDSLSLAALSGQALIISPGPMAGATGPITLAGNLAMANAECLATIAISQMVKKGTPVLYGVTATVSDLRIGQVSVGNPGFSAMTRYSKLLASYYGLPARGGGAVTDAQEVSSQSGLESMINLKTALDCQVDLILHSAGVLSSWATFSYEKFMSDLESISILEYARKPLAVNEETLALETIEEVGPGGVFLNQKHTLSRARNYPFYPRVAPLGQIKNRPYGERILANAEKEMDKLHSTYLRPEMEKKIRTEMKILVNNQRIDPELTDQILRKIYETNKKEDD
ncbi:MAG: trimethylamine methyltransferase family protein [Deltaproteobacteria bacterium]|jgi:trimethylamine--corrinoid protein Co-methyltransferase|nr:trimethylamine methyltransferase family protein [Deltaproteobacteria bacterium]